MSSLLHILRGCSKGECEGILVMEGCKGSLLNPWKGERVVRVVDLCSLERRSLVNAGSLDRRGIESGCRSRRPNHYKTRFVFIFCYLILLQTALLAHYIFMNIFKLNIFLIWFYRMRFSNRCSSLKALINTPPPLSTNFDPNMLDLK